MYSAHYVKEEEEEERGRFIDLSSRIISYERILTHLYVIPKYRSMYSAQYVKEEEEEERGRFIDLSSRIISYERNITD